MMNRRRIWSVYRKELVEILRDKRTLIGMIVVPVVLYPLMMLCFFWAAERDQMAMRAETFLIEVDTEGTRADLLRMIQLGREENDDEQLSKVSFQIRPGNTPTEQLGDGVQLRVELGEEPSALEIARFTVLIHFNEVNARSRTASHLLMAVLKSFEEALTRERLAMILVPHTGGSASDDALDAVLNPLEVEEESSATEQQRGGWALGQVIPILLVLMTITGAIYPAIDLTAGERERGTLESLMVTPVPMLDLILGKFFVVVTLGMIAAVLNIASVGATMHFGGLTRLLTQELPVKIPVAALPIIVLSMVPFTFLFSAILLAVCSFARTFKEAQNYVTPLILVAMVPAFVAALPGTQLKGILLVLPVANMVLLVRELFQDSCQWWQVGIVVLSTSLYAASAIALATRLFGQEAVMFADAGSYRALIRRRTFTPRSMPTASQALLLLAILFPASFYAQSLLGDADDFLKAFARLTLVQFGLFFFVLPLAITLFFKIDVAQTFRVCAPSFKAIVITLLLGLSTWAMAHEFAIFQQRFLQPSKSLVEFSEQIEAQLAAAPLWMILATMAIVPAITEEWLFRGYLLSGLSTSVTRWPAVLITAAIFSIYHFMLERLAITFLLGVVLALLSWQMRSIFACMLLHAMHNGLSVAIVTRPALAKWIGLSTDTESGAGHYPIHILAPTAVMFAVGLLLLITHRESRTPRSASMTSPTTAS